MLIFVCFSQVIGSEDCLWDDLDCVGWGRWGVKHSALTPARYFMCEMDLVCFLCRWCITVSRYCSARIQSLETDWHLYHVEFSSSVSTFHKTQSWGSVEIKNAKLNAMIYHYYSLVIISINCTDNKNCDRPGTKAPETVRFAYIKVPLTSGRIQLKLLETFTCDV